MTIGERIKEIREEVGLTQEELGNRLGVTGVTIMRYEKGTRQPRIEQLEAIAEALDVSVTSLLFGSTPSTEDSDIIVVDTTQTKEDLELDEIRKKIEKGTATYEEKERFISFWKKASISFQNTVKNFGVMLSLLNDVGQKKALERVEELTEIPRYQKATQRPPQGPSPNDSETIPEDGESPPTAPTEPKEAPKQGGE